jgi:cyclic pyranopterin phosphate synthase
MPEDISLATGEKMLTDEEIVRVVRAAVSLGLVHYRLTGGEPLVRQGIDELAEMIHQVRGVHSLTMTTNGVLLADHAQRLRKAGITGINVSLDTADREEYRKLTGVDAFEQVTEGITCAQACGIPIKLNAVAGQTRDVEKLVQFAQKRGLILRFIEMMPIGWGKEYAGASEEDMLNVLCSLYGEAQKKEGSYGVGPAQYYSFAHLSCPIGLIQAMQHKFCDRCNRVRLTAEGWLKPCLCYEDGTDLRQVLGSGAARQELENCIAGEIRKKQQEHCFLIPSKITEKKTMVQIGG